MAEAHADADNALLPVQISQNPKLTKLNLPMLEAIGGPLIIQNNSALASLESLEHLAAVNATGKIPSVTIPGLQVCLPISAPEHLGYHMLLDLRDNHLSHAMTVYESQELGSPCRTSTITFPKCGP